MTRYRLVNGKRKKFTKAEETARDKEEEQAVIDIQNEIGLSKDEFKLGGVLILFNNLLQSLFKSQILTLGFVMIGIFIMFLILFRNIK